MTVSKITLALAAAASALIAAPAFAQDAPSDAFTITGSVGGVSDYRYRGISQTDEKFAVQGSININHESGFYVGAWASNVDFANSSELDVYGGFTKEFNGITGDVGVYGYLYPGANSSLSYYEVYGSVKGEVGPGSLKLGVNYAPKQDNTRNGLTGDKEDNFYVYGDASVGIPNTPFTLRGHAGRSFGDSSLTFSGHDYWDYNVGADYTYKNLTFGVTYVDTNVKKSAYYVDHDTVDDRVIVSVTAAF